MSEYWADPSKSESSTNLSSSSGCWLTDDLVKFPPLGPENLVRLGEDLLHVYPIWCEYRGYARNDERVSRISVMISKSKNSPTDLSPAEATILAEMFREVLLPRQIPSQCLTPLAVRKYPMGIARVPIRTRGLDF